MVVLQAMLFLIYFLFNYGEYGRARVQFRLLKVVSCVSFCSHVRLIVEEGGVSL